VNDLAACLPQSVTLLAPHLDGTSGQPDGTFDSYAVTLASLGLPEFAGTAGFPGTKPLRTTAIDTAAVLTALARQAAVDWYSWQRARHDVRLAGCQPWQPDGLTDVLEWVDTASECSTRAYRGIWADLADQLYHAGNPPPGPGPTPTPPSATVSPPGGTEVHTPPQEFPGPVLTTGTLTTAGPVNAGGPVTVTNGPLTLPPKPGSPPPSPGSIYYDPVTNQIVFVGLGPTYAFVSLAAGGALTVRNVDGTQTTTPASLVRFNNDPTNGFLEWTDEGGGAGHASWMGLLVHKPGGSTVGPHQTLEFDDDVTGVACTVTDDPPNQTLIKYSWKGLTIQDPAGTSYGPEPKLQFLEGGPNVKLTCADDAAGKRTKLTVSSYVSVDVDGTPEGSEPVINLIPGTGISISGSDDPANGKVDVTIAATAAGGGFGPWGVHYCGPTPNRRYFAGVAVNTSAPSSTTFSPNTLYAVPFVFQGGGSTAARLGVKINTAVPSSHFRCGLYTNTSATFPYPASLVAETGSLLGSGTGVQEGSVGAAISPGNVYWCVYVCDLTSLFVNSYAGSSQGMWNILGGDATYGGVSPLGWSVAFTYGALPGAFPAGGALLQVGGANQSIPQIGIEID
jgi:hypothetical protein